MARPPLALGTPGTIKVAEESKGVWSARCRFRDHDGVTRRVAKFAATKTAARTALHKALEERQHGFARSTELAPSSTFADAAALFLRRSERRCQDTSVDIYRGVLDGIVLPALGALRLRERTVSRLDAFFGALESRYAPQHPAERPDGRQRRHEAGGAVRGDRPQPGPGARAHRAAARTAEGRPAGPDRY